MTSTQKTMNNRYKSGIVIYELIGYIFLSSIVISLLTSVSFYVFKSYEATIKINNQNTAYTRIISTVVNKINSFEPQGVLAIGEQSFTSGIFNTENYEDGNAWKTLLCKVDSKNCMVLKRYEGYYTNESNNIEKTYCDGTNSNGTCSALLSIEIVENEKDNENVLVITEHFSQTPIVRYNSSQRYLYSGAYLADIEATDVFTVDLGPVGLLNDKTYFTSVPTYDGEENDENIISHFIKMNFTFSNPPAVLPFTLLIDNKKVRPF